MKHKKTVLIYETLLLQPKNLKSEYSIFCVILSTTLIRCRILGECRQYFNLFTTIRKVKELFFGRHCRFVDVSLMLLA